MNASKCMCNYMNLIDLFMSRIYNGIIICMLLNKELTSHFQFVIKSKNSNGHITVKQMNQQKTDTGSCDCREQSSHAEAHTSRH